MIYNASAYKAEKDEKIRDFLHYVWTDDAGEDEFSNRLSAIVERLKDNDKFRSDYAAMNLHDWDLTRMAKEAGAQEKTVESARNLYANGVSKDIIAKSLQITMEELEEILKDAS